MTMSGLVGPVASEREGLLADLARQRDYLRLSFQGLTHDEATSAPTVSGLSLAGIIKHAARTEWLWIAGTIGQKALSSRDRDAGFGLEPGETLADVIGFYTAVAEETETIIAGMGDLGEAVLVPAELLRLRSTGAAFWPVRSVLLHVIEQTADHVRAADIIRQIVDRATARGRPGRLAATRA